MSSVRTPAAKLDKRAESGGGDLTTLHRYSILPVRVVGGNGSIGVCRGVEGGSHQAFCRGATPISRHEAVWVAPLTSLRGC